MRRYGVLWLFLPVLAQAAVLKDLATLRGTRKQQVLGYGIVVGLTGTGDRSLDLSDPSLIGRLQEMGLDVRRHQAESRSVAAVVCSAILPPFAKPGVQLDVTVSSLGSATSLEGGVLLSTPLRTPEGKVFVLAEGNVSTEIAKRIATVRRGGTVQKETGPGLSGNRRVTYILHHPDLSLATRIALRINERLAGKYSHAIDATQVEVVFPYGYIDNPIDLLSRIEGMDIDEESPVEVVLSRQSGELLRGEYVAVMAATFDSESLKVEIKDASVPASALPTPATTTADIVDWLREMGASVDEVAAVLRSLQASGALIANVEVR